MICRLCFVDLNDFVDIFQMHELANDFGVAQVINKYFQIELKVSDPVSTKLCHSCWQHLRDFHRFYLMVIEKQHALLPKTEATEFIETWHSPAIPDCGILTATESDDVKDITLYEPVIDAKLHRKQVLSDTESNDDNNSWYVDLAAERDAISDDVKDVAAYQALKHGKPKPNLELQAQKSEAERDTSSANDDGDLENGTRYQPETTNFKITRRTTLAKRKPAQLKSKIEEEKPQIKTTKTRAIRKTKMQSKTSELQSTTTTPTTVKSRLRIRVREIKTVETTKLTSTTAVEETPRRKVGRPRLNDTVRQVSTAETRAAFEKRMTISTELDKYIAENVNLDCAICTAPLKDFNELKQHFRTEHKCCGYAMCCNNRYRKRTLFVDHLIVHKDPNYFNCQACKKRFVSRNSMHLHDLRYHCADQTLTHACNLCEKRFAKGFLLKQHMRVHLANRERTEQCEHCDKNFRTTYELRAHVRRMHDASNAPIICDICGANFRTKQNFTVHQRDVHRVGPQLPEAQCPVCARWLRDEHSLRKHMNYHRECEQPGAYKCDICGIIKSTQHTLTFHMRYHQRKRHACTLCKKDFKKSITLKEHMANMHASIDC